MEQRKKEAEHILKAFESGQSPEKYEHKANLTYLAGSSILALSKSKKLDKQYKQNKRIFIRSLDELKEEYRLILNEIYNKPEIYGKKVDFPENTKTLSYIRKTKHFRVDIGLAEEKNFFQIDVQDNMSNNNNKPIRENSKSASSTFAIVKVARSLKYIDNEELTALLHISQQHESPVIKLSNGSYYIENNKENRLESIKINLELAKKRYGLDFNNETFKAFI